MIHVYIPNLLCIESLAFSHLQAWTMKLNWPHAADFQGASDEDWKLDGRTVPGLLPDLSTRSGNLGWLCMLWGWTWAQYSADMVKKLVSSISPDDTTNWLVVFETCSDHQREGTDVNSWVWFIKRFDVLFPIRKPTGVEEFGGSNSWIPHKFPKSSSPDAGTCSCSPAKGRQDTKQWDCRPLDLNRKPQEWFGKMHFLLKHGDFWVPHWILGVYQLRPTFRVQYICRSFNYPWRHSGGKTSIFQWSELHAGLWGATRYRFSGPTRNSDQTTVKKSGEFLESQNLEQ